MYPDLIGKTVLITGAGTGIGQAMVRRFGQEKANVLINYFSDQENPDDTICDIQKNGGQAVKIQGDVSKEEDIRAMIEQAVQTYGSLDVMINHAGIENEVPTTEMTLDNWNKVMSTNLTGMF